LDLVKRNNIYDALRFIGISCIILAHVGSPKLVFQMRNFDVPLMVLISGISFVQFSSTHYTTYLKYLYSIFTRLIIPTWIFLFFYHTVEFVVSGELSTVSNLVRQFCLIGGSGIGGLWIIRIFFSMALITPFLYRVNKSLRSDKAFFIVILSIYLAYEISFHLLEPILGKQVFPILNINALTTLNLVLFFTITYGLILLYGIRITSFGEKTLQKHIVVIGGVFVICLAVLFVECDKLVATQAFKYPPRLYYLSYALLISTFLYYLYHYKNITITNFNIVQFIGRSTLWIYLWHWFFIKVYSYIGIETNFIAKYFIIYSVSVCLVFVQTKLITISADRLSLNNNHKQLLLKVFTG